MCVWQRLPTLLEAPFAYFYKETTMELNKLFGLFLKHMGVSQKFKKAEYGYRTYDNAYKIFKESMTITYIRHVVTFVHGEYEKAIEESKWQITNKETGVSIDLVYTKKF